MGNAIGLPVMSMRTGVDLTLDLQNARLRCTGSRLLLAPCTNVKTFEWKLQTAVAMRRIVMT